MPWYAVRPRDPADPRWPLPGKPQIVLKGEDPADARAKFEQAYPSTPFGTPATPVPDGAGGFEGEAEALIVEETTEPAAPH
ncbi:hypothetical protein MKK64_16850 [Methylobacterium sp. E-025]|uniref:hypothetical protein n=1 Tax=unclassified Methylobacterium TaxID=2615210 RepID=UPI001FBBC902|nr:MULTISPECIES: hypothetical protein [unclassified Methylobacterium]MCJ2005740.1 hypothetical protein [Methylobacterium sp. J-092]MCJ2042721.1 hypothetical protein [Methylobacterium sp. J-059]MCJ2077293.1 hypothetical protein [Methylobacterium sp. E-016]MCJ2112853.1 hypothetical protein [Methylobacterium sp. E-025]